MTDADFTATLTAEQVKTCALEILSHAARAYLDPSCTEFTDGMLTEAIAAVLNDTRYAVRAVPSPGNGSTTRRRWPAPPTGTSWTR